MTIVYALIARGKAVLAEFTATAGNFPTVTRVLLNRIPTEATRMSYVSPTRSFRPLIYLYMLCTSNEVQLHSAAFFKANAVSCLNPFGTHLFFTY